MDLGIAGRAALVGGGSSGIGWAAARALAADGVCVALVARREPEVRRAAESLQADFGVESHAISADLTEAGACERAVAETAERFGGLDMLVANAGGPRAGGFDDLGDDDWRRAFELTWLTSVRLIRAALEPMRRGGWGRIVIVGSVTTVEPRAELTLSSGIRTGLVALTRLLARENGRHGICVNLVSPGYTRTPRQDELARAGGAAARAAETIRQEIPIGRMAEPEEIGAVIAFLCSQPAAFVNGVNLVADGGHSRGV